MGGAHPLKFSVAVNHVVRRVITVVGRSGAGQARRTLILFTELPPQLTSCKLAIYLEQVVTKFSFYPRGIMGRMSGGSILWRN